MWYINCLDKNEVMATCFFVISIAVLMSFLIYLTYKSIYSDVFNLPAHHFNIDIFKALWHVFFVGGFYIIVNIIMFAGCGHGVEVHLAEVIMLLYLIAICIGVVNFVKGHPYFKRAYEFVRLDNKEDKYIIIGSNKNHVIGTKYEIDSEGNVTIFANCYCCIKIENYVIEYKKLINRPTIKDNVRL